MRMGIDHGTTLGGAYRLAVLVANAPGGATVCHTVFIEASKATTLATTWPPRSPFKHDWLHHMTPTPPIRRLCANQERPRDLVMINQKRHRTARARESRELLQEWRERGER